VELFHLKFGLLVQVAEVLVQRVLTAHQAAPVVLVVYHIEPSEDKKCLDDIQEILYPQQN
jgi:hypothetical protein